MESNAIVAARASALLGTASDPAPTAGYTSSGASLGAAHVAAAAAAVPPSPASQSAGMSNCYVFKSRLQEYSQKVGYIAPEYHTLKEGPSHDPVFRSSVTVNNVKYDSLPGFFNRKIAEQSAAEVALIEIHKSGYMTECIPTVHETGLCKNMLQEYAQKMNYAIPAYVCIKQPSGPAPFICTVDIGGIQYIGAAARTKKEAEIKAARTALLAIERSSQTSSNGASQYTVLPGTKKVLGTSQPQKPLKPKKTGFKKKFSKRKFPRKNGDGSAQLNQDQSGNNGTDVDMTRVPTTNNDVNPPNQDQSGNNGTDIDMTGVAPTVNVVNLLSQDQPGNNGTDVDVTGVPTIGKTIITDVDVTRVLTTGNDVNLPNQDQDQPGNNDTDVDVTDVPIAGNDVNLPNQDQAENNGTDIDMTGVPTTGNVVNLLNQDQSGNNGTDVDVTGDPTIGKTIITDVDVRRVPTTGNDGNLPNQNQPGNTDVVTNQDQPGNTNVDVTGVPTTGNDVNPGEGLNMNEGEQSSDKVNGENEILTQDSNNMLAVETDKVNGENEIPTQDSNNMLAVVTNGYMQDAQQLEPI